MVDFGREARLISSFAEQTTIDAVSLEHALLILLLLSGLLSSPSAQHRWMPWAVLASIGLSLFAPLYRIDIAWPLLAALVLPPLLWQLAARLATVHAMPHWRELAAWVLTAGFVGCAMYAGGWMSFAGGLLLGIVTASQVWQARQDTAAMSELGSFAPLALAIVLTEIDLTLYPLRPLLRSLIASGGLGLIFGYIAVRIALRFPAGAARSRTCLLLSYAAYLIGSILGASGVMLTLVTVLVLSIYGSYAGLWSTSTTLPIILSYRGVFVLMVGVLLVLGWQIHAPVTTERVLTSGLGLAAAGLGVAFSYWLASGTKVDLHTSVPTFFQTARQAALLLLGTLWLWPSEAVLAPGPLALALLAALIIVGLMRAIRRTVFDLIGIDSQSAFFADEHKEAH
jgi:hypothetical protein